MDRNNPAEAEQLFIMIMHTDTERTLNSVLLL